MNNLFILHTQYNIILGTSVLLKEYKDDQNDLLVYAEFAVSNELKQRLMSIFKRVYFIREKYEPLMQGAFNIEKTLWNHWMTYKSTPYYRTAYDNVFIPQDSPLETLVANRCKQLNPNCTFANIEEDCYYSIIPEQNEPDYKIGWHTKRPWLIRKLLYGSLYNSDDRKGHYIYGQASYFSSIYSLFPDVVRPQLSHLNKTQIQEDCIVESCKLLYDVNSIDLPRVDSFHLFFFDLLERYRNIDVIKEITTSVLEKAKTTGGCMLMKYHPRETEKYNFEGSSIIEIPSIIPAEKLLSDLYGKNVTVYGNATTAIIVAAKLGFKTISVAGIEGSENSYMIDQFKKMGIIVPKTDFEMKRILSEK